MPKIIKTIRAQENETVAIIWRYHDGTELRVEHTAPPGAKDAKQNP